MVDWNLFGIYPLVNVDIYGKIHHFQWENLNLYYNYGKSTINSHNYGKIHHFLLENSRHFDWAMLQVTNLSVITRVYLPWSSNGKSYRYPAKHDRF